jgi:hypothetical protein
VERCVEHRERAVEHPITTGRAEQVSGRDMSLCKIGQSANVNLSSASPLNGEAALLWDSNQEDFKRKVLARHVEPSELEDN